MSFSTHPLPDYLSKYIDGVAPLLSLNYKLDTDARQIKDIVFDSTFIDIDNYACSTDIGADGKLSKDTTMALQFDLEEFRRIRVSDARVRSDIYRFIYGFMCDGIDLGSGDFSKGLEQHINLGCYDGPEKILVDKVDHGFSEYNDKNKERYKILSKLLDFNSEEFCSFIKERMEEDPSLIITACNSLMHMKDITSLREFDFIYTLPSVLEMEKQGLIICNNDNSYKFTKTKLEGVIEYDHGLYLDRPYDDMQGVGIHLKERKLRLKPVNVNKKDFTMSEQMNLLRHPIRLAETEPESLVQPFRKKIDGVTILMKKAGMKLYVKTALTFEVFGVDSDYAGPFDSFELEGELLKGGVVVIHAVWELGSLKIPWFGIGVCQEFVSKVKIEGWKYTLYSKKLYGAVDECLTSPETFGDLRVDLAEGVVANGVAAKVVETLDLCKERLQEILEYYEVSMDIHFISDEIPPGQIWECGVYKIDSDLVIKLLRFRFDKRKSNSFGRCKDLIDNLLSSEGHHLVDYMDPTVLSRYGIFNRNVSNQCHN